MLPSNARHADSRSPPEPAGAHHDIRVQMTKRTQSTFNWNHIFLIQDAQSALRQRGWLVTLMCWGRTVLVPEALGHQVFVLPGILCQKGCLGGDVLEKCASETLLKTFASVPNFQMAPIDLQLGVQLVVSTIHFRFSGLRGAMRCAFSGAAAAETRGAGRLRGRGGLGVGFTFGCSSSQLLLELEPRSLLHLLSTRGFCRSRVRIQQW